MVLATGDYRMTIKLSTKGDSGLPKLAPDLTYPADRSPGVQYKAINSIDASSSLTSLVSGTGKFLILLLETADTIAESNTAKLTIDGVVIWNSTFTASTVGNSFIGSVHTISADNVIQESYLVDSSFDFEYQTTTDTAISLRFLIRPIL